MLWVLFQIPWRIIIKKFNNTFLCFVNHFNTIQCSFLLFLSMFFFSFFVLLRFDLISAWPFSASARLTLPSLILSRRLRASSNSLNFASAVKPLYLYIKSSALTFLSKLVISANLLSTKYFFLLWDQWIIFITINIFYDWFNFSLVLNCFYLFFPLIFNCCYLFFKSFVKWRISKFSLFYYLILIRW